MDDTIASAHDTRDSNPFGAAPDSDLLSEPPLGVAGWSENMFFQFGDPETGTNLRMHCGTKFDDPRLWRGLFILYLPGDQLLVSRSFGRSRDNRGPDAGSLKFKCEEPHHRWRVTFDGAAERVSRTDAACGLVGAGPTESVQVDVAFTAMAPIWDMFAALGLERQGFGHFHHQVGS